MQETNPNIPAIIAVAREAGVASIVNKVETKTVEGVDCLVAPNGNVAPLVLPEKFLPAPRRRRARVSLYEAASFIRYVLDHKIAGVTHLFAEADENHAAFRAVIDYHGAANRDANSAPGWGEHVVELELEITPEWQRWVGANGKLLPQQAFAEFIEDNLTDIVHPDPASLLEIAQGLQGVKNVSFKSGRNLRDGTVKFELVETIELNGTHSRRDANLVVPASFRLQLVPYVGAAGVEIEARLRFRIGSDGSLSFAFLLNRPHKVIEAAFVVTREQIEKETGLPILLGSAEIVKA